MRVQVEGEHEELFQKAPELIRALAYQFDVDLEKALAPAKEQVLKYPVLRKLQKRSEEVYRTYMKEMDAEIQKVLSRTLKKGEGDAQDDFVGSTDADGMRKAGSTGHGGSDLGEDVDTDGNDKQHGTVKDFTKPIADKDESKLEKLKFVFQQRGYEASDFEAGGALFGMSVNELIDLLKELD